MCKYEIVYKDIKEEPTYEAINVLKKKIYKIQNYILQ